MVLMKLIEILMKRRKYGGKSILTKHLASVREFFIHETHLCNKGPPNRTSCIVVS